MPANKRPRRERTDNWQQIQQYTLWPEQNVYELLRPFVLFNESTAERAQETGAAERTMYRKAAQFEEQGMASLFQKEPSDRSKDTSRSLPPDMRQLIVDLKAEHPGFRPHEIATICFLRFERKPSHHTVQRVLTDGPRPSIPGRSARRSSTSARGKQSTASGYAFSIITVDINRHRSSEWVLYWRMPSYTPHRGIECKR
jgi:putative transposase